MVEVRLIDHAILPADKAGVLPNSQITVCQYRAVIIQPWISEALVSALFCSLVNDFCEAA